MSLSALHQRLTRTIGIDPATLSQIGTNAAVRRRMRECGVEHIDAYEALVGRDRGELDRLAAAIVVHETSFFRYPPSFELLARELVRRAAERPEGRVRVHCVGCSTGEEPASVVMTLLEAGLDPSRFRVDATDLSDHALDYARQGRYRRTSARRVPPRVLARYFDDEEGRLVLHRRVIDCIRYERANVLAPGFGHGLPVYDAVFCRNMLIYLVPEARRRLLGRLRQLLRPGALFFVGHAEVAALRDLGLVLALPADAFACRNEARTPMPAPATAAPRPAPVVRAPEAPPRAAEPPEPAPEEPAPSLSELMRDASRLADGGDLDAARQILHEAVALPGATADHFHLLALVESARGEDAASEDALRKAMYLDPGHHPSIAQLALLVEQRGDRAQAERLRQKAGRVKATWEARMSRPLTGADHGDE